MYFVVAARTIKNLMSLLKSKDAKTLYTDLEADEIFDSYDAALQSVEDEFTEFECEQVDTDRIYNVQGTRVRTNFIVYKWLDNEPEPYVFTILNVKIAARVQNV